ncbi:hypothetical protein GCM10009754_59450 [Amycolatopsis minnesotensis]|uniref:Uncharacterized protein n=1 Tax=Amycolatopsis minnesotensis TaxID=337894 RepID=A0ABP5D8X2_9PSEU
MVTVGAAFAGPPPSSCAASAAPAITKPAAARLPVEALMRLPFRLGEVVLLRKVTLRGRKVANHVQK